VKVAKFGDHLPLYRQEKFSGRAGLAIPRSTLGQWVGQTSVQLQLLFDVLGEAVLSQRLVHADETSVQMLAPGEKKPHRAYVRVYSSARFSALKAVVYDFSASRAGEYNIADKVYLRDVTLFPGPSELIQKSYGYKESEWLAITMNLWGYARCAVQMMEKLGLFAKATFCQRLFIGISMNSGQRVPSYCSGQRKRKKYSRWGDR
jgi:hypothetical protein